jgi:hypothetical protein
MPALQIVAQPRQNVTPRDSTAPPARRKSQLPQTQNVRRRHVGLAITALVARTLLVRALPVQYPAVLTGSRIRQNMRKSVPMIKRVAQTRINAQAKVALPARS